MSKKIAVNVAHVDPIVAAGLGAALRTQPDFEVEEQVAGVVAGMPRSGLQQVVVTDYAAALERLAGLRTAGYAAAHLPAVLVVTQQRREWEIRRALEAGVQGYLLIGCAIEELGTAVRSLGAGMRHIGATAARLLADSIAQEALTPREEEVLGLVVEGLGNKAVARNLGIGIGTVKSHLRSIYGKLDATTRTEAVTVAERRGLLDHPPAMPATPRSIGPGLQPRNGSPFHWPAVMAPAAERVAA